MLATLFLIVILLRHCEGNCRREPNAGPLRFTENLTAVDYARSGRHRDILCCAAGYDSLLWYHKIGSSWRVFPWFSVCDVCEQLPFLRDDNKTLDIQAFGETDAGHYKCVAEKSSTGNRIEHTTFVHYFSCSDRSGPPEPFLPRSTQYVDIGKNITITCKGDYGCDNTEEGDVMWYMKHFNPVNNTRYTVTTFKRSNGTVKGANLTITNVKEEDFNKVFICDIGTIYIDPPPGLRMEVRLKKKDIVINKAGIPIFVVAGIVGLVVVVCLVVIPVCCFCGKRFSFFIRSRTCIRRLPGKGDKKYHVFIYHTDYEDPKLVDTIVRELKKRHYDVASVMETINYGEDKNTMAYQLMNESYSVIFIIPKEGEMIENDKYFLINVLSNSRGKHPAYITLLLKIDKNASRKDHYLKEHMQGFVDFRLPDNEVQGWRQKEFYSKIQLRLPKPNPKVAYQKGQARNGHDEKPLLSTPTPTPVNIDNKTFDFENADRIRDEQEPLPQHENTGVDRQISEPFVTTGDNNDTDNTQIKVTVEVDDIDTRRLLENFDQAGPVHTDEIPPANSHTIDGTTEMKSCVVDVHNHPDDNRINIQAGKILVPSTGIPIKNDNPPQQNETYPLSYESGYASNSVEILNGKNLHVDTSKKKPSVAESVGSPSSGYDSCSEGPLHTFHDSC